MVNTHKKGQRKELLCQKELQKDGYEVFFKSCTVKRGPRFFGLDFADIFDVIGAKHDDFGIEWKFISCKHAGSNGGLVHLNEIAAFKAKYGYFGVNSPSGHMSFERWTWFKPGYHGRGKARKWESAHWKKEIIA